MKWRTFIGLLGDAAIAWPVVMRAQQAAKTPRIGIIDDSPIWNAFRHGLRDLGYVDGQNIAFEYRYAGGMPDRLAWVAVELVRRPVDLIATFGTVPTLAAKQATTTIPIVMMGVGDPVGSGLVPSLGRPGGNIILDDQRSLPPAEHREDHRFSHQQSATRNVRNQRGCGGRRPSVLRREPARPVSARRCVRA
jgi:ABC-type uncharacterized transport system substrate-binding protein